MNRLESNGGDDGFNDPRDADDLRPYGAFYRFNGHTFEIVVWEKNREDAARYCREWGLKLDGLITERTP